MLCGVVRAQCKCLRVLQFFPPPETPAERTLLHTILTSNIEGSECCLVLFARQA